jgi:PAS domain S-box-containing protein
VLLDLARVFSDPATGRAYVLDDLAEEGKEPAADVHAPNLEAKYRALLETDTGGCIYGLSRPRHQRSVCQSADRSVTRLFARRVAERSGSLVSAHSPHDKQRWSLEAAEMFLSGKPLRSAYRVIARDGRVIWFHCDAKMMRRDDGRPWFIHIVAFDISDLKRVEEQLQEERNFVSAILDTVGALVADGTSARLIFFLLRM